MKIKLDFVTNSSSCSFTILTRNLNELHITAIENHIEFALLLDKLHPGKYSFGWDQAWTVDVYDDRIELDTSMDNFDMSAFVRAIGITDEDIIDYDHSNEW